MEFRERALYHQIHPAKLATDIITTIPSLYLLWNHELIWGLLVTIVPSLIASFVIMEFVDLTKYARSSLGRYVAKYMRRGGMQAPRFLGLVLMMIGAWYQVLWVIFIGLIVVLLGWLRGLVLP